jgi:hypothetical protein
MGATEDPGEEKNCTRGHVFVIVILRFHRHPPAGDLLVGLFQPAFDLPTAWAGFFLALFAFVL